MGLIGQGSKVGERVEEGISEALHEVGNHGVGLGALQAIERWKWVEWEIGFEVGVGDRV